jgi:hypothetical protein
MRTTSIDRVILLGVALAQVAGASPREGPADALQGFAASSAPRLRIPDVSCQLSGGHASPRLLLRLQAFADNASAREPSVSTGPIWHP